MLSFDQAVEFLSVVLGIENVAYKLQHQRLQLLTEYTAKFHQRIPFQNLTLLEKDVEERDIPTMDAIIRNSFAQIGGMCYSVNFFTNQLLLALGYESYQVLCTSLLVTCPYTHVATVAKNVRNDGDLYMVELGASFPTFQPIPIHNLPQEYCNAFLRYKFVKEGNQIVRYHVSGKNKTWFKFIQFEPVARDEETLHQFQLPVYTKVGHADGWYLTGLRMTIYPEDKAITLNDYSLKLWSNGEGVKSIQLKNKQELETAIRKYFPTMKNVNISKALSFLKPYQSDSINDFSAF